MTPAPTFKFLCPHCEQRIAATLDDVGAGATCPTCSNQFLVPEPPNLQSQQLPSPRPVPETRQPVSIPRHATNKQRSGTLQDTLKNLTLTEFKQALVIESVLLAWRILLTIRFLIGILFLILCYDWYDRLLPQFQWKPIAYGILEVLTLIAMLVIHVRFVRKKASGPELLLSIFLYRTVGEIVLSGFIVSLLPSSKGLQPLIGKYAVYILAQILLIWTLRPCFTKFAELYFWCVGIDKHAFVRAGAMWPYLSPEETELRVRKLRSRERRSTYAAWTGAICVCIAAGIMGLTRGVVPTPLKPLLLIGMAVVLTWVVVEANLLAAC